MKWPKILKNKQSNLFISFGFLGLVAILSSNVTNNKDDSSLPEDPVVAADTFIPAGFTLVPIELANSHAIESIISQSGGVVDLYLAQTETQKGGLKVGSKLKMIQAPLNPDRFAVLIKESEGHRILKFAGPFIAVIHNPAIKGSTVADTEAKPGLKIHYQN